MGTCTRERGLLGPASLEKSFTVSMGEDDKMSDIDRKKAEVRARLEAQAAGKKAKKGFMTPERKKKLRLLLRKKAAEELKKEQERKAAERRKVIDERCGLPKDLENASEDQLKQICKEYFDRMYMCESQNTKTSSLNSRRRLQNSTSEINLRQSKRRSSPWTKKKLQRARKRSQIGLLEQRRVREELSLQTKIHPPKLRLIKAMLIIHIQHGLFSLWNERPPQKWPHIFLYCV